MLPLAGMLFNVVAGLVVDKAQDLAHEHVEKMIDDILPDEAKEELDKIIAADPSTIFNSAKEALLGAAEGKATILKKDGNLLPIEINIKLKFDPNTNKIEMIS